MLVLMVMMISRQEISSEHVTYPDLSTLDHIRNTLRKGWVVGSEGVRLSLPDADVVHELEEPGLVAVLVGPEDEAVGLGKVRHACWWE
jgi:hypothetical protein